MQVHATSSESYRTFDSNCAPTDQTCAKDQSFGTARFMFGVTHKNFRPGGWLQTYWNLSFNPTDCAPKDLQGALIPFDTNDIPSEFKAKASSKSFTRSAPRSRSTAAPRCRRRAASKPPSPTWRRPR
jgi:hypothetical protein